MKASAIFATSMPSPGMNVLPADGTVHVANAAILQKDSANGFAVNLDKLSNPCVRLHIL